MLWRVGRKWITPNCCQGLWEKKVPSFWKTVEQLLVKPNTELTELLQHGILFSLNKSVSLTAICMNRHKICVPNSPILESNQVS